MDVIVLLSVLVLFSNVLLVVFSVSYLLEKYTKIEFLWSKWGGFVKKHTTALAFIVALVSTLGSLYLSEVKEFTPCVFCWYQRILMYPLVFVTGSALVRKARDAYYYVLPLSFTGILMSSYHYYVQLNPKPLAPCSSVGFSISCSDRFFTHFGYITIPFMALTGFILISVLMLILSQDKS